MARHSVSSGGNKPPPQRPQAQPPSRSASAPPPQFKVPKPPITTNKIGHPGVRRSSICIGKSPHPTHTNNNNNIMNEVKPKIQSAGSAPTPTAMLSRSTNGRFQPRASSSEQAPCADGMVSRGTFLPQPPISAGYPSGCPGGRMT